MEAKIFGSDTAVSVITDLMKVVGIESYDLGKPLARILQDALVLPIFDGRNLGVRRRQLHNMLQQPGSDPLPPQHRLRFRPLTISPTYRRRIEFVPVPLDGPGWRLRRGRRRLANGIKESVLHQSGHAS